MTRVAQPFHEIETRSIRATAAFLENRLNTRAAIDWALSFSEHDFLKRRAVLHLLERATAPDLKEPWLSAWRLIEESWRLGHPPNSSVEVYQAQSRLRAGERSGALVDFIVNLVSPRLAITRRAGLHGIANRQRKKPLSVFDLLAARITSGDLFNPDILELEKIDEPQFLIELAISLEAEVSRGLAIARRLGWQTTGTLWRLGEVYRVYYVGDEDDGSERSDPDVTHTGLAPSIKILNAVIGRLAQLQPETVTELVQPWRNSSSPIHLRLWAAAAVDPNIVSGRQIGRVLADLGDTEFWQSSQFPEIAELRAVRFENLSASDQQTTMDRILRGPPSSLWPRRADREEVQIAQQFLRGQELRRVQLGGADLPDHAEEQLDEALTRFPDLIEMDRIDYGFLELSASFVLPQVSDDTYDHMNGVQRLHSLETALRKVRQSLREDAAGAARRWMRGSSSSLEILTDFEVADGGSAFPNVWDQFGWIHTPESVSRDATQHRDERSEAMRVLSAILKLDDAATAAAIEGISAWLGAWSKIIGGLPDAVEAWNRVWPFAVMATDSMEAETEEARLDIVAEELHRNANLDLDTLNTPVGRLVGFFLQILPDLRAEPNPFCNSENLRTIRDRIISSTGKSGLISRHRLIEHISYFNRADAAWAEAHLVAALRITNGTEIPLWRALTRRGPRREVMRILGSDTADRTLDARLDRETRGALTFRLVIDALFAFENSGAPAVPSIRLQQVIRLLEDELRARAASAVTRFVKDLSRSTQDAPPDHLPEDLFRTAVVPFLHSVWPQETSLVTPGVSKGFSELPAASGDAFAEAVDAIRRFLVPFDCWSLVDYGLWGKIDGQPKLSMIDTEGKARALLELLDLTIGSREGAVIPYGLGDALQQIEHAESKLVQERRFRRLATLARRL